MDHYRQQLNLFEDDDMSLSLTPAIHLPSPNPIVVLNGGNASTMTISNGVGWQSDNTVKIEPSGIVEIRGEKADIVINGESLIGMLKAITDQLNMLKPNPEMEQAWDELAELRQAYEEKLAECKEKTKMWDTLQK